MQKKVCLLGNYILIEEFSPSLINEDSGYYMYYENDSTHDYCHDCRIKYKMA